ncbi:MAG: 5-(carboxyamino)imidazole ribonucleotide mutase [Deltaproteobacteria bacterium]|nr:5-(carboxyamino)imidazole ribonucleotide mutase [Deltaproteobacteria bacterium]
MIMNEKKALIGIVIGSDSDLPVTKELIKVLKGFNIGFELFLSSAHRTPERTREWAISAKERGIEVIIALAGYAAHLPGVVASYTTLPVIGVPIDSSPLKGIDSLLSIVEMPSGIPVATMGIGTAGAKNSALFALSILANKYPELDKKIEEYRKEMATKVEEKGKTIGEDL